MLPTELIVTILDHLSPRARLSVRGISARWNDLVLVRDESPLIDEVFELLVQAARSNPLQLINPFAPAKYGDGEANILRKLSTKEVEGLKLWQISF